MLQALRQHLHRYRYAGFGIAVTMVLLCALLAGCSSYIPSQGGQSQTTPTSIPAFTPSSTLSQSAQNCGKVDTSLDGKPVDANQARLAGNCFWQAFQSCQAASLILKVHSLDTGANHTFTMNGTNGKCSILDTVQHYIAPNNLNTTNSYTCSGLVMQADGLHFIACGSLGNIFMPI